MNLKMKTIVFFFLFATTVCCYAIEDANIIAAGDWSTPVSGFSDKGSIRGAHRPTLRGRLLLCESPKNHSPAIYLELQDCANVWGVAEIYCDMNAGGGCRLESRDAAGLPILLQTSCFSGGTPGVSWITLPCDATVRLRVSAYATFSYASTNDYFVAGIFTVDPPANHTGLDVFQGTIHLPPMKILVTSKPG
jgi:hypothetical protein